MHLFLKLKIHLAVLDGLINIPNILTKLFESSRLTDLSNLPSFEQGSELVNDSHSLFMSLMCYVCTPVALDARGAMTQEILEHLFLFSWISFFVEFFILPRWLTRLSLNLCEYIFESVDSHYSTLAICYIMLVKECLKRVVMRRKRKRLTMSIA